MTVRIKPVIFLICFVIMQSIAFTNQSTAQHRLDTTLFSDKLSLIHKQASFIKDSLHALPGEDFYTELNESDSLYTYLYVSSRDSVYRMSPGRFYYFGTNPKPARIKADSLTRAGMEVMVYQTAGTSASEITQHLLGYDDISISFIMLHEAMHIHLVHAGFRVSYDNEESIGDVVGNAYLTMMLNHQSCAIRRFVKVNERVYRLINRCLNQKIDKARCEKRIRKICDKKGSAFQKERYMYPVNNAYLLRFRDYTQNYFLLKKKFRKGHSLSESLQRCFGNPYSSRNKKACNNSFQFIIGCA